LNANSHSICRELAGIWMECLSAMLDNGTPATPSGG
jgi:hypothetical protein